MTKRELIEILSKFADDEEIRVVQLGHDRDGFPTHDIVKVEGFVGENPEVYNCCGNKLYKF